MTRIAKHWLSITLALLLLGTWAQVARLNYTLAQKDAALDRALDLLTEQMAATWIAEQRCRQ